MNSPPDDSADPEDQGTVLMPAGFQRSSLRAGDLHTPTLSPLARSGATQSVGNALPLGTRIGEFQLTRVIGEGGFGIVYEASDTSLERRVAVKEYMPTELAERTSGMEVRSLSEEDEEIFRRGLQSFINEAKILARFDNASLVKVYRFWEANGTAYMVMPFYEGPTLLEALRKLRQPPDEDWLRRLLEPLTQALAVIHDQSIYHRDISPDNILLLAGTGRPLLLDFGAARRVIQDANQNAPTAIVKPGYAPIEQYSDVDMKQGPWSDVYALAAVLHFAITGKKPPAAIARLAGDAYVPLVTVAAGRYNSSFLAAIDKALIVRPKERTQGMDAFRADLGFKPLVRDASGALVSSGSAPSRLDPALSDAADAPLTTKSRIARVAVQDADAALRLAARARWRRRAVLLLSAATGLAVLGGAAWWLYPHQPLAPPAIPPQAIAPAPVPTRPAPPATDMAAGVAKPEEPTTSPPAPAVPFSVVNEFSRIQAQSTPGYAVTIQWKAKQVFRIRNRDLLAMSITSMQEGYLYVLAFTPDNVLFQYFPNDVAPDNFVKKQTTVKVPRTVTDPKTKLVHEGVVLTDPPGLGRVLVIVSKFPRDFSGLGVKRESIYPVYPAGPEAEALQRQTAGGQPLYLGRVVCPSGPNCEDHFGAIMDTFEIVP